jgi:uncharacterized protein YjbI with pentapeptide repeats/beta-lactamase regulating signal transducer with metallopeptidase domain
MIEAIVGVALRAILASVLLGAVLSALVLIATRRLALTAATRHALWTTAMIATAAMPLAGIAVSLARATPAPKVVAQTLPEMTATAALPHGQLHSTRSFSPHSDSVAGSGAAAGAHASRTNPASLSGATETLVAPPALTRWTPRVTRVLAIGVVAAWSLGALIGLIGLAASVVRIRGLKRRSSPLDGAFADELPWLTATGPGREIYLRLSYEIETPVAVGFGQPVILIPTELAGEGGLSALEPLVLHEHAHLRRYDDWTNLVQRTIERVFWFNPIVWLVGRRIALEREIASDDVVVEKTGEAHAYATSLWRLAREMRMPEHAVVAPGALLTRRQIAVRIEELLDANRGRRHRSPVAALATALAGIAAVAFVATSAPAVELPAKPEPATAAPSSAARPLAKHAVAQTTVSKTVPAPSRTVYVYVPVSVKHDVTKDPTTQRVAMAPIPEPPRPMAPEVPAAPAVAIAPPLPRPPALSRPTLAPHALAAIRAAARRGTGSAAAFDAQIGAEVGRAVGNVLAHLPDIAQLDGQGATRPHRVPPSGAKLSRDLIARCNGCVFRNADLHGIDLHDLTLKGDDFEGADLRGANLAGARLVGVSLRGANLGNADLRGARLSGVELRGASLAGAQLDDISLLGVSLRGPGVSGVPMRSMIAKCTGCDLSHVDLHGQDLHDISLAGVDFSHADFHGANLSGAQLMGVNFSGANLSGADLTNARLDDCDLRGISLRDAVTTGMTTHGSSLDG